MIVDGFNNVYIRKGRPGIVPVVAAHLDTVHQMGAAQIMQQAGRLIGVNEQGAKVGLGADDKAGVFVCLELLERFENIAVILFAGEEIGCIGAQNAPAEWFKDAGYFIEFDCPGCGLVSYTSGDTRLFANDGEFIKTAAPVLRAHGLTHWQHHPFSDVKVVRQRFDCSCLNLSCGYYNWHKPDEFIVLNEVEAAINAGEDLILTLDDRAYPFKAGAADESTPIYQVTGLQVNVPPEAQLAVTTKAVASDKMSEPEINPGAATLNLAPLAETDEDFNLWDRHMPTDVPFFKMGWKNANHVINELLANH